MGGRDPYSNSKACAELVTSAYRESFFGLRQPRGGRDRSRGQRDRRRRLGRGPADPGHHARGPRPGAVRDPQPERDPPLAARAQPAQRIPAARRVALGRRTSSRTAGTSARTSATRGRSHWILERLSELWGEPIRVAPRRRRAPARGDVPEARLLEGARAARLGARWDLDQALTSIVDWYKAFQAGGDLREHSLRQIEDFAGAARMARSSA